ncbi:hypothetical protein BASA81_000463 [Batrachochytrium salamandrivorans]|nr:hypothetical protein BASA81_000463 [Batrachochytrium salamandrivorans]
MEQRLVQSDPALEAFERLKVREIKLVICEGKCGVTLLKAALADPQASKICALVWEYDVEEDMNSVIPLLNNNCPELALLLVKFEELSDFDLVSSLLEHPCAKVKVLVMPPKAEGAPNNEMKELSLWYDDTASSIKTHLVPALKHPNCNLSKLSLGTNRPEHKATAFRVVGAFRNHRVLVVLLQGQQLRRRYCDCPWRC